MDCDYVSPCRFDRRNKVRAVQHVEISGDQFETQKPAFVPMVTWSPEVLPHKIFLMRYSIGRILAAMKHDILVDIIQSSKGRQQLQHIAADATHLVMWEACIDPDLHRQIVVCLSAWVNLVVGFM